MIQKAALNQIKAIHKLLKEFGDKGQLLSRPLTTLYDHVRDFSVYIDQADKSVIGCCALSICWEDLAEIRSLAVNQERWGKSIGAQLVLAAISEAKSFNIKKLFTLTYQHGFFKKLGFEIIDKSELPLKIWSDCISCVKFPDCDEIAMIKRISF
jgi:amino-acid N-acetyltransferase